MTGFLVTYGPQAAISCLDCHRSTRMVPPLGEELGPADVGRYKRIHVHGSPSGGWDVADRREVVQP